ADALCVAHLAAGPLIVWRWRGVMAARGAAERDAALTAIAQRPADPAVAAARDLVAALAAAAGNAAIAAHAAVFRAFEALAAHVDLAALARLRPRRRRAPKLPARRAILVI